MALGNLKVTLELVADKFVSGIREAEKELAGFGRVLSSPEIAKPLGLGLAAAGAAAAAAGAAIGASLTAAAVGAAHYGNAMQDAAQKTGINAQTLAGYKLLADQSGTSLQGLGTAFSGLSKNMLSAATNSKGVQAQLFSALGIAVKDAAGNMRSIEDVIPQVADKLKGIEDGGLRAALAQRLMGRAAVDNIPFFLGGSEAMNKAKEATERFALANTDAENAMGAKFNASVVELQASLAGLSNQIGLALLPELTALVDLATDWVAVAAQWAKANPEIAEGLAGISVFLAGGGVILTGLGLIVSMIPSMTAGLTQLGITWAAVFGGAAAAGVIALGAAVGYLTGQWINGIIAASGYQKEVDRVINTIAANIPGLGLFATGGNVAKGDTKSAALANAALEAEAKRRGMTPAELIATQSRDMAAKKGNAALAGGGAGDPNAEIRKLLADMEKTNKNSEIDRFNDSVAKLKATLTDTTLPSKELVTAIHQLEKEGGLTSDVIYALAKDFDTLKNSHDPLIQSIVAGLPFIKMAKEEWKLQAEQIKLVDAATKAYATDLSLLPVDMSMAGIGPALGRGDIEGNQRRTRQEEAIKNLEDQRQAIRDLGDDIVGLNAAGLSATEIEQALGISLESVSEQARELGVNLDPVVSQLSRTQELSQSWGESLGAVSDKLVDMIVDFDFSFKRLGDIAKSTFKSMATSFLDGFFKPFKDALTGVGESAGNWLGGLVFGQTGGGQSSGGGILGSILGGGGGGEGGGLLGGLFGGGKEGGGGGLLGGLLGGGGGPWDEKLFGKGGLKGLFGGGEGGAGGGLFGGGMGGGSLPGEGYAYAAGQVLETIRGGLHPGQKATNSAVAIQNSAQRELEAILNAGPGLSATDKLSQANALWADTQAALIASAAGGPEFAKASNKAIATLSHGFLGAQRDLAPIVANEAMDRAAGGGGGNTINGDVNISFVLPEGITPEGWLDWLYKNKAGIGTAITETVLAMEGAIVTH